VPNVNKMIYLQISRYCQRYRRTRPVTHPWECIRKVYRRFRERQSKTRRSKQSIQMRYIHKVNDNIVQYRYTVIIYSVLNFRWHEQFEEIHQTRHKLWWIHVVDTSYSQWRSFLKPRAQHFTVI